MARWRNSEEAKKNWAAHAPNAPYRASVGSDICWETDRPSYELAAAMKASRQGHRLLLAFELADVRDYFVLGYHGQDAQVEPDQANEAGPARPMIPILLPRPDSFETAKRAVRSARQATDAGLAAVRRVFNNEAKRLVEEGDPISALRLIRSMHADCVLKTIAIEAVRQSGQWDCAALPFWKLAPLPLTRERAAVLRDWLQAHLQFRAAEEILGDMVRPLAQEILDREGPDALEAFNETLPRCFVKVSVADMVFCGRQRAAEAAAATPAEDEGSAPSP